ncbi:MAG: RagB/SusD family nutrient uptake outer membrane protein, partial [Chitinophagaceae bacterium]
MKKKFLIIACGSLMLGLTSCKKWLDIQPKTNISERVLFEDEQGFKDALTGVYVQLANPSMYAKEFTMATMDVLAQQYDVSNTTHGYYETGKFNYENGAVQSRINQFWAIGYKAIANINNLLASIDYKKNVFTNNNYELIKGEALGLRAFIHFDLFRAFGPIPANGFSGKTLPYLSKFEMKVKPYIDGNAFLDSCMRDLDEAIVLLEKNKAVNYGTVDPFLSHTRNHFNYWAANGLKARIALYRGDLTTAYNSAQVVIEKSSLFPFIQRSNLTSGAPSRTFLSEQLFGIYTPSLKDINEGLFKEAAAPNALTNKESFITQVFEGSSTDFRSVFLWKTDGSSTQRYPIKYWEDDIQTNVLNTKRIPLIRLSEMYYIAAEATDDLVEKTQLINTIRSNRGISALASDLTEAQLDAEIFKEYRKEFYQEGQLFFYYKRKNTIRIENYGNDMTIKEYVLPIPNDE